MPLTSLFFLLAFLLDFVLVLDVSLDALLSVVLLPVSEALDLPELVSAGVLVAFSCSRPEALMSDVALSSPVDFEALPLAALSEVAPAVPLDDVPLPVDDEFIEALPLVEPLPVVELPMLEPDVSDEDGALLDGVCEELYVEEVVLGLVLGAFLFLCMSPSARAEPLAIRMTEEKNTGASLRMG